MRELVGKIPTKDPDITQVVYLSEIVRCLECERTVPVGIEVVTVKRTAESWKPIRHVCYCRAHGLDYETKAQNLPMRPRLNRQGRVPITRPGYDLRFQGQPKTQVC